MVKWSRVFDNYAVRLRNEKEADYVFKMLGEQGVRWADGRALTEFNPLDVVPSAVVRIATTGLKWESSCFHLFKGVKEVNEVDWSD